MAYIVINDLIAEVAEDDPAFDDPSIEVGVNQINLGTFDFESWFQSLPIGTRVQRRRGYWERPRDEDGDDLLPDDPNYHEGVFEIYKVEELTR